MRIIPKIPNFSHSFVLIGTIDSQEFPGFLGNKNQGIGRSIFSRIFGNSREQKGVKFEGNEIA